MQSMQHGRASPPQRMVPAAPPVQGVVLRSLTGGPPSIKCTIRQDAAVPRSPAPDERMVFAFGSAIEDLRLAHGWTRAQVCAWSGGRLAYSTLAGIENGHRAPGERTLTALAAGLGVPEESLTLLWARIREGASNESVDEILSRLRTAAEDADRDRLGAPGERLADISEKLASAQAMIATLARSTPEMIAEDPPWQDEGSLGLGMLPGVLMSTTIFADASSAAIKGMRPAPRQRAAPQGDESINAQAEELTALARSLPQEDLLALLHLARALAKRVGSQQSEQDRPGGSRGSGPARQ